MKCFWLLIVCSAPLITEAAKQKSNVTSNWIFLVVVALIIFIYKICSCIYSCIAKKAVKAYKGEMENIKNQCKLEKDECVQKCEMEKKACSEKFFQKEKELRAQLKSFENKLAESYKFRESMLSMRERICFRNGNATIEECKKIDKYFVQIQQKQVFLDKWEKDLESKDVQKQRSKILDEKEDKLKHKEELLVEKDNDLKKIDLLIKETIACYNNSYPPLAKAITDFCLRKTDAYEHYLRVKPHRALKKADVLSDTKQQLKYYLQKYHEIKYLLDSYESLFPWIVEFREFSVSDIESDCDFSDIDENMDAVKKYISQSEYLTLSSVERNQKALNRYIDSHKSKVQIGRLYERYIGYQYELDGYDVEYFGAIKGFEDLGRDIIAAKGKDTCIIQCKNWGHDKMIRENAICQLYGTVLKYRIDTKKHARAILVTSTAVSPMAHEFAKILGVEIVENHLLKNYPMIKCNIGKDGEKIYHLPFDQMYDRVKIEPKKGEMYVENCFEAEMFGFRRAFRWSGE